MRRALLVVAALLTTGLFFAQPAQAIVECDGVISDETINSSIYVPSGETCNLQHAEIRGSVYVKPGGRLNTGSESAIRGSVHSYKAGSDATTQPQTDHGSFSVMLCNTHVWRDVDIVRSIDRVTVGGGQCGGNRIDGWVNLYENAGGVEVVGNAPNGAPLFAGACPIESFPPKGESTVGCGIGESLDVHHSSGSISPPYSGPESAIVAYNVIGDYLACFGNDNGVRNLDGVPNQTGDGKFGQCRNL